MSERWHTLPAAGGLLDQPAGLMERMNLLSRVVNAIAERNTSENWAEWINGHPKDAELINLVQELRSKHG